ncbi:MAG TPA: hypothetical protein PLQ61_06730 [Bacteroidales bacterium]|nr:hypothetical protein [Petrotogaceae bacterium]HQJ20871.1 hypothetical protein [Bacteroidales bacterium]
MRNSENALKNKLETIILKIERLKVFLPEERNLDAENFNNSIEHAKKLVVNELKEIESKERVV